ncbi:hypothetical protein MIMGU_mgv1a022570mg, partial [Erythranthe guttata]
PTYVFKSQTNLVFQYTLLSAFNFLYNQIFIIKKMDNSNNMSYQAGQTKGQAEEKGNQMMEKASNAAQSAKESMQEIGQQAQAKAQGAVDAVKNATGMNK